jgi:DNA modification methylase
LLKLFAGVFDGEVILVYVDDVHIHRDLDLGYTWGRKGQRLWRAGRLDDLKCHLTVKPVALVADAIKDCTGRGAIVLDTFCGSGTTILAAERVGRRAYTLEIEPRFVDLAIRRWQAFSRKDAIHVDSGLTFDELASKRNATVPDLAIPDER